MFVCSLLFFLENLVIGKLAAIRCVSAHFFPLSAIVFSLSVASAGETAPMQSDRKWPAARAAADDDQVAIDLASDDAERVRRAVAWVRERAVHTTSRRAAALLLLVNAGRYADADGMATDFIRSDSSTGTIGQMQWVRVQIMIAQQRWSDALSGARSYFECCDLSETPDAVGLIAVCLQKAHPDDFGVARRFEQQQILSAMADGDMTRLPRSSQAAAALMSGIPADPTPFADAAEQIDPTDFRSYVRKANLMLISSRPRVARELFQKAVALASRQPEYAEAYLGQARAIRAEHGCLGPANAFIASLQSRP